MDDKTSVALKGSIKKWEEIVNRTGIDHGAVNCPLCELFPSACRGCLVHEKGHNGCNGTPYSEWADHQRSVHSARYPRKIECPKCERLAREEVCFLKSLLPEEPKKEVETIFVIKDDKSKEECTEIEISLHSSGIGHVEVWANEKGKTGRCVIVFRRNRFYRWANTSGILVEGIEIGKDRGRILEDKHSIGQD